VIHNVQPSAIGVAAGFTFGDGTAPKPTNGQISPAKAFLCGPKDLVLAPYFISSRQKLRSDGVIEILDLPRSWKVRPDLTESQSYLYGWLSGYFAADGTFTSGQARLASGSRENLEVVRDVCARIGIATNPIRVEHRLGYGLEKSLLYTVALIPGTLREDFFLIHEHRERFAAIRRNRPADWKVASVELDLKAGEVMCAVVPEGHMFTLEDNLLTHTAVGFLCPDRASQEDV
jgi:DNA primase